MMVIPLQLVGVMTTIESIGQRLLLEREPRQIGILTKPITQPKQLMGTELSLFMED